MRNTIFIYIIIFLLIIILIYYWKTNNNKEFFINNFEAALKDQYLNDINTQTDKTYDDLKKRNDYLEKVRMADENIFNFIRCINIPRTPACKNVQNNTGDISSGRVCRSRQIDCNKFKLVLENDPIAVERMKLATDQYTQSNEPENLSDLTYKIRSGWMF